jgi:pimeloyl-ACP methyl ester carboxylesterase
MVDVVDTVEVDGLRIAFERVGHGPPLLLLHGFVGDGTGTWRYQLDSLSDAYTVIAWDAPGAGRSSAAPESFRLSDFADCLSGFVGALGLAHPHVGGLSFGAALAMEFYHRHRAAPRTLIFAGATAGWSGSYSAELVQQRLRLCLELSNLPAAEFAAALLPSMFSSDPPRDRAADFGANLAEFQPEGFRIMATALAEANLSHVLPDVTVPTLLLYGDQDVRAPLDVAEVLHAAIPGSRLVVMPGVGHVSPVEAPDLFTAEVRTFLNDR